MLNIIFATSVFQIARVCSIKPLYSVENRRAQLKRASGTNEQPVWFALMLAPAETRYGESQSRRHIRQRRRTMLQATSWRNISERKCLSRRRLVSAQYGVIVSKRHGNPPWSSLLAKRYSASPYLRNAAAATAVIVKLPYPSARI